MLAMNRIFPLMSYNALLRYAAPFLGLDINLYPLIGWRDKITYAFGYIICNGLCRFHTLMYIASLLPDFAIGIAIWLQDFHYKFLVKQYDYSYASNIILDTEQLCPLNIRLNDKTPFELNLI